MSRKIELTAGPIPRGALDQHIAILGKTRSGKSTVMRGLVEDLLDRDKPVCMIDPKGDWWGIKLARDGKGPGYPVVIFGGPHADVPINEHAGAHVAELFATGNRPCLIDLKGWMPGERTRFWVAFASTLFRLTKGHRWLAVDEIHNFAPKAKILDPDSGKALHWANRLASEGLGMGIAMLFASQRPQKVHNDLLTSAETLIAMRVLHPSDRQAIADWIKGCGDPVLGAQVLGTLAQMDRGEGWAWSPEIGFGPKRVKFPIFGTYDSFRPQTAEDAKSLKGWAEVNLEDVKIKLADVVKEAEANDPARLRKMIAELERRLAAARAPGQSDDGLAAELREAHDSIAGMSIETEAAVARAGVLVGQNTALRHRLADCQDRMGLIATALGYAAVPDTAAWTKPLEDLPPAPPVQPRQAAAHRPAAPVHKPAVPSIKVPPRDGAPGVQQRILDALAELEAIGANDPARILVANLAGYGNAKSTGFVKALGGAHTSGYVEYGSGSVKLTDAGRALADAPAAPLTEADLHERIKSHLGSPGQKILDAVIAAHPAGISRSELAIEAGYQNVKSTGFVKALGQLRTLGFVDYRQGEVVAEPVLFSGGRR